MKKLILIFLPTTLFGQYTIQNNTSSVTILPNSIKTSKTNDNIATNVSIGSGALKSNTSSNTFGNFNIAIGYNSLYNNGDNAITGESIGNTGIGGFSLFSNTKGNFNTAIGLDALGLNMIGNGNVGIGYAAGYNEIGNNKLYIHNNSSTTPLIWGDFENRFLGFHGKVGIGTKTPIDFLNIHDGTVAPQSYIRFTTNLTGQTATDGLRIGISEFNAGLIYNYEDNPIHFGTNDLTRMTILGNGNVGIGYYNPTGNLHVHQSPAGPAYFHLTNSVTGTELTDGISIAVGPQFNAYISQKESAPLIISTNGNGNQLYLKENGNIGINNDQPTAQLDINGFTKLGSDAPKVKLKKILTTTGANQGDIVSIAHGLTSTKIIAVNVLVDYGTGEYISHNYTINGGYEFHFVVNTSSIEIKTKNGNSGNILSKPVKILITYEE